MAVSIKSNFSCPKLWCPSEKLGIMVFVCTCVIRCVNSLVCQFVRNHKQPRIYFTHHVVELAVHLHKPLKRCTVHLHNAERASHFSTMSGFDIYPRATKKRRLGAK